MTHEDISDAEIEAVARAWYRESYRPHEEISDAHLDAILAATTHDGDCTNVAHTCLRCEGEQARRVARAAILASRAALLAEGKKVVAREPSEAQTGNAKRLMNAPRFTHYDAAFTWRAMWDAAP